MNNSTAPVRAESFQTMKARRDWLDSLPANDNEPPRPAKHDKPRHRDRARALRPLLAWRAAMTVTAWTEAFDNDNDVDAVPLLDSKHEVRPRISEIRVALRDVETETRRHARDGGGGPEFTNPVGGDMEVSGGNIVRLGGLHFSNGKHVERGPVLRAGRIVQDDIPIPRGGLIAFNAKFPPRDRFGAPRGFQSDASPTVLPSQTATPGAYLFDDPVAANDEARHMRAAVKPETAEILDMACSASNFRQVGEHLGLSGKTAERQGKMAVIEACEELERILAV